MIVDFVKERGGGFLMLGGKNSFSAGQLPKHPDRRHPSGGTAAGSRAAGHRQSEAGIDRLRQNAQPHAALRRSCDQQQDLGTVAASRGLQSRRRCQTRRRCAGQGRAGKQQRQSDSAGLPAVRTRPLHGVHHRQQLALADGDGSRRPDFRALLEADAALACQRLSGSRHDHDGQGHLSSGRSRQYKRRRCRQKVQSIEQRSGERKAYRS